MSNNTASSWLTVNLQALAANYNIIKNKVHSDCQVAGVVKANGYGLGIEKVWAALENQNCPLYFVATLDEALTLRKFTKKPVAVLGGLYRGCENLYVHETIMPVLNSLDDINRWSQEAKDRDIPLQAIIHFDTGMNRLGLGADETPKLLDDLSILKALKIEAIMTHFACADDRLENPHKALHPITINQAEKFLTTANHFPDSAKSLANSAGVFCDSAYHLDIVRPGMALYGLNPTPHTTNPMQNVISLKTRVLQVRQTEKNETVGYGATYRFENNAEIATVALGYADGILRSLSNNGNLYFKGKACPIIGRVSMDLVTADISHLEEKPQIGDTMEIINDIQTPDMIAGYAGTIGYEILTSLGQRYQREYI